MSRQKASYPAKQSMNLFYKPDRTTRPATIALYVLFAATLLLGFSKILIYDLWAEVDQARRSLDAVRSQLDGVMTELSDYDEVLEQYRRYAATEEERALIDRIEVIAMLDEAIGTAAEMSSISISGDMVQVQFSGVTLAQTAEIVRALEASPIVAGTVVNTASTAESTGARVQASVRIQLQKEEAAR